MFRRNYGPTVCASILHHRGWHCPIWMRHGRCCWRRRLNGVGRSMHRYDSKLKLIVWAVNSWFNRVPEVGLKSPWGRSSQLWPMTLNNEFLPSPMNWRVLGALWRYIHRTQHSSSLLIQILLRKTQQHQVQEIQLRMPALSATLSTVAQAEAECNAANVEENDYTVFSCQDLEFELELVVHSITKKITFIDNQVRPHLLFLSSIIS